jgi:hypothetical protein
VSAQQETRESPRFIPVSDALGFLDTLAELATLSSREDDPLMQGVERKALRWLEDLYRVALALGAPWLPPYVTANPTGEIVFEWWRGPYTLTVYVAADRADYVLAWGTDITREMEDGRADTLDALRHLLRTLTTSAV